MHIEYAYKLFDKWNFDELVRYRIADMKKKTFVANELKKNIQPTMQAYTWAAHTQSQRQYKYS